VAQEDSRTAAKDIVANRIILDLLRKRVESGLRAAIVIRLAMHNRAAD
jgi:hypothetical protein